jgi:hypothetical protein
MNEQDPKDLVELGAWLGRHQAFGMIANRCSAADAECLKQIRDSGHYKKLGQSWAQFCEERAGISRVYADRLINHLKEFGANYFRLSEVIPISPETYRLIAGAVSEEGLEVDGQKIPLTPENRKRVLAAVEKMRGKAAPKSNADTIRRKLDAVVAELKAMEPTGSERLVLIGALDEGARKLGGMAHELRAKALSLV